MSAPDTPDPVEQFYACVNTRAEAEMLAGRPITGAHHRALEAEIVTYRANSREPRHCPTCRHHTHEEGDHWCALGISTGGRVSGLVTHRQPFGCSLHEGKETGDDE